MFQHKIGKEGNISKHIFRFTLQWAWIELQNSGLILDSIQSSVWLTDMAVVQAVLLWVGGWSCLIAALLVESSLQYHIIWEVVIRDLLCIAMAKGLGKSSISTTRDNNLNTNTMKTFVLGFSFDQDFDFNATDTFMYMHFDFPLLTTMLYSICICLYLLENYEPFKLYCIININ